MEYDKMSNKELENEMSTLEENFKECQDIIREACSSMEHLSTEYNKIKEILKQRNGQ